MYSRLLRVFAYHFPLTQPPDQVNLKCLHFLMLQTPKESILYF